MVKVILTPFLCTEEIDLENVEKIIPTLFKTSVFQIVRKYPVFFIHTQIINPYRRVIINLQALWL